MIGVPISSIVIKSDTTSGGNQKNTVATATDKKFECVFVKSGNKAKLRVVKTGVQDDSNIEVLSGLKTGDPVITGPYTTVTKELKPDDVVTVEKKTTVKKAS